MIKQISFQVADAHGKIPEGIFLGNTMALGSYDSCMDIHVQPHSHNSTEIEGFW